MKKKILFVFGTRPEAIKMAPLINLIRKYDRFSFKICVTGQHREMLDQVLNLFNIVPDYDLKLMKPSQTLSDITVDVLCGVDKIIKEKFHPDLIVVQGDTTTAFGAALAAFYSKVQVVHMEAGLRSFDTYSPFPEEMNRVLISKLATFHFAPTENAAKNLIREGINREMIWNVGNTVIDALIQGLQIIKNGKNDQYEEDFHFLDRRKKLILVTGHRRENFGAPFENVCYALKEIVEKNTDVEIVYPVHLNPNVKDTAERILGTCKTIHLLPPLSYSQLIWVLSRSEIVITDSGGIQEEAPTLGKPVLVMRDVTERMEGIEAGTAKLVGTDRGLIVMECERLLNDTDEYNRMSKSVNPYGDGTASLKIITELERYFEIKNPAAAEII